MPDQKEEDDAMNAEPALILIPDSTAPDSYTDAAAAVDRLEVLYNDATSFLSQHFSASVTGAKPATRIRAFYPEIRLTVSSHIKTAKNKPPPRDYHDTPRKRKNQPDAFKNALS